VEPHAYLSRLFERLPHLKAVEDYEAMLPWNIQPSSSAHVARPADRPNAIA
jgi:hypothetical protein